MFSLNPCFSGSWVVSEPPELLVNKIFSLNPCFSGSWVVSINFKKMKIKQITS